MAVVQIEILGRRYALQSDREPAHVQEVASFVDESLRQVASGDAGAVRRDDAILAALNIASELFLVRQQRGAVASAMDRGLGSLEALLDQALSDEAMEPTPSGD